MQKSFNVKNITIGEGQPVICVPVTVTSGDEIIQEVKELVDNNVKMIEWRVDWFDEANDVSAVLDVLKRLKPLVADTALLFTFRTKKQGGNLSIPEEKILELNETASRSGTIDLLDLEFFEASDSKKEIKRFKDMGVKVIASHHDFEQTPEESVMKMLLEYMQEGGADVVKLAVMPNSLDDVLRLMSVTNAIRQKFKTLPVVTMSMGRLGIMSRFCGEMSGSCITFGSYKRASAPGQIALGDLEYMLDIVHKNLQ